MVKAVVERNTRQKQAIRAVLERAERPLSVDDVHALAERTSPGLGLATVYRAIKSLLDERRLSIVEVPGRSPFYEVAGKAHHHHFSCNACARVYELEGCASVGVKLPRGFTTNDHDLTLYGTCAACTRKPPRRRRSAASAAT